MEVNRVEVYKIKGNEKLERLCYLSNNLYNQLNYINRQRLFKKEKTLSGGKLEREYKKRVEDKIDTDNLKDFPSQSFQQPQKVLSRNWKSFWQSMKAYKKDKTKFKGLPKPPKYKDKGKMNFLIFTNQQSKIVDNKLIFSVRDKITKEKIIEDIELFGEWGERKLSEVRVFPLGNNFYKVEVVYRKKIQDFEERDLKNLLGIDLGLNNFLAISSNKANFMPKLLKGKDLKAINIYFNYKIGKVQRELKKVNNQHKSKKLKKLWQKRDNIFKDFFHKTSKKVLDLALENEIDTIIIGHNKGQKQKVRNKKLKNFIQVPIFKFISILRYKLEENGIRLIEVDESYTSGTSFLDKELPNKRNYNPKRRKSRGNFISNDGIQINSDINGSLQIMKRFLMKEENLKDLLEDLSKIDLIRKDEVISVGKL